jgi:hypothetical protein
MTVTAAIVFALTVGVLAVGPPLTDRMSAGDYERVGSILDDIERENQRQRDLDAQRNDALARIREEDRMVNEIVAMRMTLAQAAVRLRDMHEGKAEYEKALRLFYPGGTLDERVCRNIIEHVRYAGEGPEWARRLALLRVQYELHALLRQQPGGISLPK